MGTKKTEQRKLKDTIKQLAEGLGLTRVVVTLSDAGHRYDDEIWVRGVVAAITAYYTSGEKWGPLYVTALWVPEKSTDTDPADWGYYEYRGSLWAMNPDDQPIDETTVLPSILRAALS